MNMKTDEFVKRLTDSYGNWFVGEESCARGTGRMTSELWPYDSMFSPIQINSVKVKNRIVMAPMGNIDMCEETGRPNAKMLQYFFARAKGGAGLLTTGLVPVSHGIDNSITEPGKLSYFPRIDRSRTVQAGWRDLAQGVHAFGTRIFVQLTAGLGRVGNPQCLVNQLKFPNSASLNPNFYIPQIPCLRLSDMKLKKIIRNIGQAAADAKASGLDGVYLHGHEGYLIEQLTNPAFNRRSVGRYSNWQTFGIDMVKEIRRRVGDRYPIMYRIDLSLALNETYGETMDVAALKKFKNGRTTAESLDYMANLVKAGVDIFDVDLGCYDNWWLPHPPAGMPAGCFLDVARKAKAFFDQNRIRSNAGLPVPVVAVGKLGYPDLAEKALRDGFCDMVMLGRPLLADPEWPNKAYAGKVGEICPCIGCQEGCINEFVDGGHPQCAVNPRTGFEDLMPEHPRKADKPKRIAVVGAGPGGAEFALRAASLGHSVDLYEKSGRVGGKLCAGSVPKIKFDLDNYRIFLENRVRSAAKDGMLSFISGVEADADMLAGKQYDVIVTAVGTKAVELKLPGAGSVRTVLATELLENPELLENAKSAAVIGGGVVGCETAYWLSYEKKCRVSIVEMLPYLMDGSCTANRGHLIHYMKRNGVTFYNMSRAVALDKNGVKIVRNVHKNVPDPGNTWQPILPKNVENPLAPKIGNVPQEVMVEADIVVFALGGRPDDSLAEALLKKRAAPEIYNIGDSFSGGRVLEATRAAWRLAEKL